MLWFRRTVAIGLIGFGIALIVIDFPDRITRWQTSHVVTLAVEALPYNEATATAEFGTPPLRLKADDLQSLPGIRREILASWDNSGTSCAQTAQWQQFEEQFGVDTDAGILYSFRDGLQRMSDFYRVGGFDGHEETCWSVEYLGAFTARGQDTEIHVDDTSLEHYPCVAAELQRLADGPVPAEAIDTVPVSEWERFEQTELGGIQPGFTAYGRRFSGIADTRVRQTTTPTPEILTRLEPYGIVAAFGGLIMMFFIYGRSNRAPGIPVVSPLVGLTGDTCATIVAALTAVGLTDACWVHLADAQSLLGMTEHNPEAPVISILHLLSIAGFAVGLPVFTYYVSSMTVQRIQVGDDGITSIGLFGSTHLSWDSLEAVHVRTIKPPLLVPSVEHRSALRVLELEGNSTRIVVHQPSSWQRKDTILEQLHQHIPETSVDLLSECEERW